MEHSIDNNVLAFNGLSLGRPDPHRLRKHLSKREIEIAQLLSHGLNTEMVAEQLFISPATVRNHVHAIRNATSTKTRAHALCTLIRRGVIT